MPTISAVFQRIYFNGFFNSGARTLSGYGGHVDKALSVKFVASLLFLYLVITRLQVTRRIKYNSVQSVYTSDVDFT